MVGLVESTITEWLTVAPRLPALSWLQTPKLCVPWASPAFAVCAVDDQPYVVPARVQPELQGESETDVAPVSTLETFVFTQAMPETPTSTTLA